MIDDMDGLPTDQISAIVMKGTSILTKRAGAVAAPSANVPVELDAAVLPPIDRSKVRLKERLPDGSRLWMSLPEVEEIFDCDRDAALEKAKRAKAAIQIGGKNSPWRVHRFRLAAYIQTEFK